MIIKEHIAEDGPKLGISFPIVDKLLKAYQEHARLKGFYVAKRSSHKGRDGVRRYQTISCEKGGSQKQE